MPGRKARPEEPRVFVDLAQYDIDDEPKRRIRVSKASSQKDLSVITSSLRAGIPMVIDTSSVDGAADAVRALASEFGAVAYEVGSSVWLISPAEVRVERVRSR